MHVVFQYFTHSLSALQYFVPVLASVDVCKVTREVSLVLWIFSFCRFRIQYKPF